MDTKINKQKVTNNKLTNEEILEILKSIYEKYGKITRTILKKEALVSSDTIRRKFGSLCKAYELMNIDLSQGQRKNISKEEINVEIYKLIKEYGYISKPIMEKYSSYSPKIVQRIYGSFGNMYIELNLKRHPSGRIPTDKDLLEECERIYKEQSFLSYDLIEKFSTISTTCFKDRSKKNKWGGINYYRNKVGCEIPILNWCESPSAKYAIDKFTKAIGEEPIKEKRFNWLINKEQKIPTQSPLRIDAYYPDANIAIEYNGPQHYFIDGTYTKTEEELIKRKELDKLKANLIKAHGIKLIVIHFKDKVTNEYVQNAISNNY